MPSSFITGVRQFCIAAFALFVPVQLNAATFSIPITPELETNELGEFLSASFDIGKRLSRIESVSLKFLLPEGFRGSFVSTGNSSYSRSFVGAVHDGSYLEEALITTNFINSGRPFSALTGSPLRIPANELFELILFEGRYFTLNQPPNLPEFLFAGKGQVTFVVDSHHITHPLPSGVATHISINKTAPTTIESVRLIIQGTPIPEPSSLMLATASSLIMTATFRKRKIRS